MFQILIIKQACLFILIIKHVSNTNNKTGMPVYTNNKTCLY